MTGESRETPDSSVTNSVSDAVIQTQQSLPETCLPTWDVEEELPQPKPLGLKNLAGFIGPGIVMCGIQIGGGEWLFGPDITAKYGGSLMWIATIAIACQVFYNMECGRYALYTGEPVFTGFMRMAPGPTFWVSFTILLSIGTLIPGLSTNAAVLLVGMIKGSPPIEAADGFAINCVAYILLALIVVPVLLGGKVYNMLQAVMTAKVFIVLGFCLFIGVFFVSSDGWLEVFSGFFKFGTVPVEGETLPDGRKPVENIFATLANDGTFPVIALTNIALLGAFAGYAGGGGLGNSTYSNFVRDKGWGMGSRVGAIASAVGGKDISLSHIGKVFALTKENLKRWKAWWKYILFDQLLVWAPGCFMGMALPALMSIEFAQASPMFLDSEIDYAQSLMAADGIRNTATLGSWAPILWLIALFVGLMVFVPSQISIVDDFSRRWTDIIWSSNKRIRSSMKGNEVRKIYYVILGCYVLWSFISATIFLQFGNAPKLMVTVIANLNNVALGSTAFMVLYINRKFLPEQLRPKWYNQLGIACCGVFYLGLALLVLFAKVIPMLVGRAA